jgi:hypothetical protein
MFIVSIDDGEEGRKEGRKGVDRWRHVGVSKIRRPARKLKNGIFPGATLSSGSFGTLFFAVMMFNRRKDTKQTDGSSSAVRTIVAYLYYSTGYMCKLYLLRDVLVEVSFRSEKIPIKLLAMLTYRR